MLVVNTLGHWSGNLQASEQHFWELFYLSSWFLYILIHSWACTGLYMIPLIDTLMSIYWIVHDPPFSLSHSHMHACWPGLVAQDQEWVGSVSRNELVLWAGMSWLCEQSESNFISLPLFLPGVVVLYKNETSWKLKSEHTVAALYVHVNIVETNWIPLVKYPKWHHSQESPHAIGKAAHNKISPAVIQTLYAF